MNIIFPLVYVYCMIRNDACNNLISIHYSQLIAIVLLQLHLLVLIAILFCENVSEFCFSLLGLRTHIF